MRSIRYRLVICQLILVLLCLEATNATPLDNVSAVVIIKSSNITAYDDLSEKLISHFGKRSHFFNMRGRTKNRNEISEYINQEKPELIITIGSLAARTFNNSCGKTGQLVLLVSRPDRFASHSSCSFGIRLEPSPKDQLAYLKIVMPGAKRVGIFVDSSVAPKAYADVVTAAAQHGIDLVTANLEHYETLPQVISYLSDKSDALLLIMQDEIRSSETRKYLIRYSISHAFPLVGVSNQMVRSGSLVSSVVDYNAYAKTAIDLAEKAISGRQVAGYQYPPSGGYVLNTRIVKYLGIETKPAVINGALESYE